MARRAVYLRRGCCNNRGGLSRTRRAAGGVTVDHHCRQPFPTGTPSPSPRDLQRCLKVRQVRHRAPPRYTKCACGRTLTDHRSQTLHQAANEARSLSDMRRVALASAALAFCLPAQWVAGASAAVACLTAATGRRLGASARLGVAIVASATRLDSTLSQELPHALARVMAHATRSNARLASRKCDRPRSRQSTAC